MDMPLDTLGDGTAAIRQPRAYGLQVFLRRLAFFTCVIATTVILYKLMAEVIFASDTSWVGLTLVVLFTITSAWIGISFWTAFCGFLVTMVGDDPLGLLPRTPAAAMTAPLARRYALIMPIYNEDIPRVFAGLAATWRSLMAEEGSDKFDAFILSDTQRPEQGEAEELAFAALVAELGAEGRLFYRRRARNVGRKAGNVEEFCARWGAEYEGTVVLDADSVMTGPTIMAMARLMQAHPQAGIIQTLPVPVNRRSLFGRAQQFASRLNGRILTRGLNFWQLGDGNYWGHNAILRTAPFLQHAKMPVLRGSGPLSGHILSHDFVEAAFMRRAGYRIWMVPELGGSFEEVPSNLIDYAGRDRRWCQGNLQHARLAFTPGLHWLSRLHLTLGIMAYATSPLWLVLLVLSTITTIRYTATGPTYFGAEQTLFPLWPISKTAETHTVLIVTLVMLFVPKLLGLLVALVNGARRRRWNGAIALIVSWVIELAISVLQAPIMMLVHTRFVVVTLLGRGVDWVSQPRDDRPVPFKETLARFALFAVIGLAWGALVQVYAPSFLPWLMPVLVGLVLAAPLVSVTSWPGLGMALKRAGLLMTPEEVNVPPELKALEQPIDLTPPPAVPAFTPEEFRARQGLAPAGERQGATSEAKPSFAWG
ncbi:glucans biosynthesis glucosyltransferase MdoH [Zavarzinia sp. CC-PAN008]|uniref:glucans biosynthesis glucosyltransferase MdoH n=1 Tax=Zavarzinia sp. CC-PAN008 TaxID=3243332 RepID=UPI003F749C62